MNDVKDVGGWWMVMVVKDVGGTEKTKTRSHSSSLDTFLSNKHTILLFCALLGIHLRKYYVGVSRG